MKFERNCGYCQFNFGGFCTAKGFGQAVESDEDSCELWEISEESLLPVVDDAPWYLKKPYQAGKMELDAFLSAVEQDSRGEEVELNLYDAIEEIYGMTQQQIAGILGVSSDVVGYARAHGTVERRISHFSQCLCIPEKLFRRCTTEDLPELEAAFQQYQENKTPEFLD